MSEPLREFAVSVVEVLRAAGFEALFAGGCVRDLLLGVGASDYDVATNATPDAVIGLFRRTTLVGVSFGVVRVLGPRGVGEVEVATFRTDGEYRDGRHPESVEFGTAEADASRRDFTINGMFLDPISGEVIDYVGGRADLDRRVVRAIGDPGARFAEDKLRLLRAVRFTSRLGFTLDPATAEAVRLMAPEVRQVSVERIAQEWSRMITHPRRSLAMELTRDLGLLDAVLPLLASIAARNAGSRLHPNDDVWASTMRVLDELPGHPTFPLAMAALLHGLGSGTIAGQIGREWKLSNADRERIAWLVERQSALLEAERLARSRLKRLLCEPGIDELLSLHRAIAVATTGDLSHVAYCERYRRDQPNGPLDPVPLVNGRDLIEAGIRPGPRFSLILEQLRDAQLDGTITTKDEAIALAQSGHAAENPKSTQ